MMIRDLDTITAIIKRMHKRKEEGKGSREESLALTKLEEAAFWLNKAITKGGND